jgi:dCTP deaminase
MILSDSEIQNRIRMGLDHERIVIDPMPSDEAFQPASIDLHLAAGIKLYRPNQAYFALVEPGKVPPMADEEIPESGFILDPDMFVLASTVERIHVPTNLIGVVDGKSSLGRMGLAVHITAGFIDPGFRGNITLELKNVSNSRIVLRRDMSICQLRFHTMLGEVSRPYGTKELKSKYQDSVGTVQAKPVSS